MKKRLPIIICLLLVVALFVTTAIAAAPVEIQPQSAAVEWSNITTYILARRTTLMAAQAWMFVFMMQQRVTALPHGWCITLGLPVGHMTMQRSAITLAGQLNLIGIHCI